jgi:hypothetical protein
VKIDYRTPGTWSARVCSRCGAAVYNPAAHTGWHEAYEGTATGDASASGPVDGPSYGGALTDEQLAQHGLLPRPSAAGVAQERTHLEKTAPFPAPVRAVPSTGQEPIDYQEATQDFVRRLRQAMRLHGIPAVVRSVDDAVREFAQEQRPDGPAG